MDIRSRRGDTNRHWVKETIVEFFVGHEKAGQDFLIHTHIRTAIHIYDKVQEDVNIRKKDLEDKVAVGWKNANPLAFFHPPELHLSRSFFLSNI